MVQIPTTRIEQIEQIDPPNSSSETLPTMYDLPSEDPEEPGLPDEFHDLQPQLLSRTLRLINYSRENCFTASDLNLYYDVKHHLWHKRPDWFLVVNVSRLYEGRELRRSYVSWQEGKFPYVVVEFLSPGTESEDLGRFYSQASNNSEAVDEAERNPLTRTTPPGKFEVYEQYLRVPHYIVYSRYTQQLRYFKLEGGCYLKQSIQPQNPRIWLADLEIGLGVWSGVFEDVPSSWLRWCDRQGNWLLTDTEQERVEKEQAQLEKEQAQAQLRQAAQNLMAAGMDVDRVAEILGLSSAQVQAFCQSD
ncbi:Uma2 family endonuclease [Microcoleus sp. CAWBG58]|uniref:Uma2 family endonuclease n=1 Tax=Microcoleus sp. CAWBG58 TaxID=2841651 RepID=UPI0025CBACBE|nr:Uma2 family endonuclease [Microcoleus sp. CAWBG58]